MSGPHFPRRALLGAPLALALGGCRGCGAGGAAGKPLVAVSIFPLFDVARRVAGDRLSVELVLPPGRSEHGYDPSPKEVAKFADARLTVSVGLGLDGWLEKLVENAAGGVTTVQLGPKLSPRKFAAPEVGEVEKEHEAGHEHHHDHEHGGEDPHVWLDPTRMATGCDELAKAFATLDPEGKTGFEERAAEAKSKLQLLHTAIGKHASSWKRKTIVTFHGSMGYFAERYGLTIAAVIEPFPGREPTAKYVADVLAAIEKAKPAALFSEPQLDKKPAEVIAAQAKLPLFQLDPVGGGVGADTYEALLLGNAAVLDRALA